MEVDVENGMRIVPTPPLERAPEWSRPPSPLRRTREIDPSLEVAAHEAPAAARNQSSPPPRVSIHPSAASCGRRVTMFTTPPSTRRRRGCDGAAHHLDPLDLLGETIPQSTRSASMSAMGRPSTRTWR